MLIPACAEANLRQAVSNGDLMGARRQIEGKGLSPELPNDCGWTLLHHASYYQHTPLVEYLVGRSVDVNAQTRRHSGHCIMYSHIPAGSTPLIIAAYYGQTDIVRFLLRSGAERKLRNAEGYDALMYARKYEFAETVQALQGRLAE
jgi:ankyrin repeat protein